MALWAEASENCLELRHAGRVRHLVKYSSLQSLHKPRSAKIRLGKASACTVPQ